MASGLLTGAARSRGAEEELADRRAHGRGAGRGGDPQERGIAVVVAMAFRAAETGPSADGGRVRTLVARGVAFQALRHGRQQDVLALARGPGAVGVGAFVAVATAHAAVGGVVEGRAPPPDR